MSELSYNRFYHGQSCFTSIGALSRKKDFHQLVQKHRSRLSKRSTSACIITFKLMFERIYISLHNDVKVDVRNAGNFLDER